MVQCEGIVSLAMPCFTLGTRQGHLCHMNTFLSFQLNIYSGGDCIISLFEVEFIKLGPMNCFTKSPSF